MSKNSFKVRKGLTLSPVDPSEIINPEAGDLIADSTDDNKIKRYDATSADWASVGGSAGIGGNLMAEFEKLTPDLVDVTSAVDTVTFLPIDDNNKSIKATFSGTVGSIQFQAPIDSSLHEIQGTVSVWIRTSVQNLQVSSVQDGVKLSTLPVSATNKWKQYELPVVVGGTEMGFIVESLTGVTGDVYIDQPFVGLTPSSYGFEVAQAEYLGKLYWTGTTGCGWVNTNKSNPTDMPSDTDCPTPIVQGRLTTPSTKIPAVVIPAGSPAGTYEIDFRGAFVGSGSLNDNRCVWQLSDGITTTPSMQSGRSGSTNNQNNYFTGIKGSFTFDSAITSDKTITIKSSAFGDNCAIYADSINRELVAEVIYYPPKTTIVTTSTNKLARTLGTLTYAGTAGCQWANSKTTTYQTYVNDPDCPNPTFSTEAEIKWDGVKRPSFTLPAGSKKGQYDIVMNGIFFNEFNTVNIACSWRFSNGTIHSTNSVLYTPNNSAWDSSKSFVLHLDEDLTADTTFNLQSVGYTTGSGSCWIVNLDYNNNNQLSITVNYTPREDSSIIAGQFEQIKTTELSDVRTESNANQVLTANVTPIPFIEVSDEKNIWTGDTLIADMDANYLFVGSIRQVSAGDNIIFAWKSTNGGASYSALHPCKGNDNNTIQKHFVCLVKLNKDDRLQFRSNIGNTLTNALPYLHYLNIVKIPDTAGIVKNLNDRKSVKYQKKVLGSACSLGPCTDISFNNLTVGRTYEIKLHGTVFLQLGNDSSIDMQYEQGGVAVNGTQYRFRDQVPSGSAADATVERNVIFKATATDLSFRVTSSGGSGTEELKAGAVATLMELPDYYIETDEW